MERLFAILEIIGTLTGLAYIIQASRLKRNCWIYGIISTAIFAIICFNGKLYVDGSLNIYYVVMGIVGWFSWGNAQASRPVSWLKKMTLIQALIFTMLLGTVISFLASRYTDADFPILDSTVGAFAITATWLTTQKKVENWLFWIVSNSIAATLFLYKEYYYFSGLMVVYLVLSVTGFVEWKKQTKHA